MKVHAPPKSSYPTIDIHILLEYDAALFGILTRYGNFPAQWKAFWDRTGGIWASGGYWGKYAGKSHHSLLSSHLIDNYRLQTVHVSPLL